MKPVLKILSFLALALILFPPVLFLADSLPKSTMKLLMLVGTIGWFATVPWWMGRQTE